MKVAVLLSAGAQDANTSGYEQSDLEDIEFFREKSLVDLDAVSRPRIGTPFSARAFNDFDIGVGGSSENPIVLVEEGGEKNSPSKTPVTDRPNEPPMLLRSRPFGGRIEKKPEFVYSNNFEEINSVRKCNFISI